MVSGSSIGVVEIDPMATEQLETITEDERYELTRDREIEANR